ncbi:MAG: (2Fe-2S)-binding protein [Desulfobulbaceae bacterium]|nr:(2Fe-2S)-binding protein [Desulfobulbaceae bacterium]
MSDSKQNVFYMNKVPVSFVPGQSIAEALLAHGITELRKTVKGRSRGVFCNMGLCGECRVIIDGLPNYYSCQELAREGIFVETQMDADFGVQQC